MTISIYITHDEIHDALEAYNSILSREQVKELLDAAYDDDDRRNWLIVKNGDVVQLFPEG